ncbi:right-handed parallel beta-helix repeat-containing protein [uncultured Paludibaculum sp.]|uniref:right-handed parallel beta-helix repeat-containing protein n=1 Tax=uncultured Paludibaculum sp. TaxID=1765020 RepID=UPI002AAB9E73|nr:right-handed parallel beta-helix repeat-containing protein [uncultured Paludibaculum sp.]
MKLPRLSWRQLLWSCFLVAIPSNLLALDGIILIDQNRALAGNITPGDAPGFPVTISQSGMYRLTGNITVPDANTTAVQITSSFVTLDLNGFSIIGPTVCTDDPIACPSPGTGIGVQASTDGAPGPRGVRVVNGTVRGMGAFGILMTGDGSFVEKVTLDSNAGGGVVAAGTVLDSAATHNGRFGILAITVRECTALKNAGNGINLDGSGGVGIGNISSFNTGVGISVPNGSASNNTMVRNQSFGLTSICPSSIVGNTIVGNDGGSIQTSRDGCVLVDNATRP